ncbi:hypothetical protein Ga0466249_005229 [Sporomusaceae bacterium BoRhaA]|nr:hypothetical protein [Pelorhabdus rhamnosifermentans]
MSVGRGLACFPCQRLAGAGSGLLIQAAGALSENPLS